MDKTDKRKCPLCNQSNQCALEQGAASCWCFSMSIPKHVLDRVPEEQQNKACICQACAEESKEGKAL